MSTEQDDVIARLKEAEFLLRQITPMRLRTDPDLPLYITGKIETALAFLEEYRLPSLKHAELLEMAWIIIANVNEGDWLQQNHKWVMAANKWRDKMFPPSSHT